MRCNGTTDTQADTLGILVAIMKYRNTAIMTTTEWHQLTRLSNKTELASDDKNLDSFTSAAWGRDCNSDLDLVTKDINDKPLPVLR